MPISMLFQSTPPVKAATVAAVLSAAFHFISIHAAREGGDDFHLFAVVHQDISIHAAREGGDPADDLHGHDARNFNPRRP